VPCRDGSCIAQGCAQSVKYNILRRCVHTKCRLHIAAACCCGCCGTVLDQRHTGQREALGVELLRGFVALCVVLDRVWYCACVDCDVLQDKAGDAVN
jgi:hypothetical protein